MRLTTFVSEMDHVEDEDTKTHLHSISVFNYAPHVLTEIFTNLSLNDRKSVRLVCKDWYEACNAMKILAVEKLVCRDAVFGNREAFVRTIENTSRKILNLEFVWVNLADSWSLAFWKTFGPKIRSLWFTDCSFSEQTLKHVILYGCELQSLSLKEKDYKWECEHDPVFGGYASLDELVDSQIRRESLSSIEVNVHQENDISSKWIQNLFTIHPNIKDFTLFSKFRSAKETGEPRKNHRFSILSQILTNMRTTFESIVLGELDGFEFPQTFWETNSRLTFPRLRKIRVTVRPDVPNQVYVDFFTRHPQLKVVIIATCFNRDQNGDLIGLQIQQIVGGLLQACVHLRSLKLESVTFLYTGPKIVLPVDEGFFAKLLDSSLITFNYDPCLYDMKLVTPVPADTCIINNNLNSLSFPRGPERDMTALLSRLFQGLTHLEVHVIDDDGLQSILKFQNNLRSLILNDCKNLTEFGFTGYHSDGANNNYPYPAQGYSMKKLRKLQYLCLKRWNRHVDLDRIFAEFCLPDLLHLFIQNIATKNEKLASAMRKLFTNLPKLEGFTHSDASSYTRGMDLCSWFDVCSRLKNLHFLSLDAARLREFRDEECKLMFKCCPKLRFLTVNPRRFVKIIHDYGDHSNYGTVKKLSDEYHCKPVYSARCDTHTVEHFMYSDIVC